MKFRKPSPALVELFETLLPPLAESRKMFGVPCAFLHGHMFLGLFQDDLFVRLSEDDRAELLGREGAHLFEPMPGRPMRAYVVVPQEMHEDESELKRWVARSFAYADSLPPKAAKPAKKAPAKTAPAKRPPRR